MVRFLQVFDHMELALDAQPANAKPPAKWASGSGRQSVEKIIPTSDLTLLRTGQSLLSKQSRKPSKNVESTADDDPFESTPNPGSRRRNGGVRGSSRQADSSKSHGTKQ